jgi:hypothetical protein
MSITEPQPAEPKPGRRPFQFTLRTLLLLFVVLGSSLGVFGAAAIVAFPLVVGLAIYIRGVRRSLTLVAIMISLAGFIWLVTRTGEYAIRPLDWPAIATLFVWLLSVGTLLTQAVRSRKARSAPPVTLAG